MDTDECIVSCIQKIGAEKIRSGVFSHLEISWPDDGLVYPSKILPPVEIGRYSKKNQTGYEVVHKDRPMTTRSWTVESPNFGDPSKGYHDVEFSQPVYQRDYYGPKLLTIHIEYIGNDIQDQSQIFRFTVEDVLNRTDDVFSDQLLFNLNLLQENTGNHDVYENNANTGDYLDTLYVNWEILPLGEKEDTMIKILGSTSNIDPDIKRTIAERYDVLQSLKPNNFIKGTNEFRRYFGAQFAEDLVVFENIDYGNAIYIMFDDWEELSRLSRTALLSSTAHNFDRITHTKTWKRRLKRLLTQEKLKRGLLS